MVITKKISLHTKGECDIVDITAQVEQQVAEAGIYNGTATVFVAGSTAGLTTIEFEPGLLADFQSMWERNAPKISITKITAGGVMAMDIPLFEPLCWAPH